MLETDPAGRFTQPHEALKAPDIARRQTSDLGPHRVGVCRAMERRPVMEANLVKWINRLQRHIRGHVAAANTPEFLEQERRCHDGGAGVKGEAILAENRRTATGSVEFL